MTKLSKAKLDALITKKSQLLSKLIGLKGYVTPPKEEIKKLAARVAIMERRIAEQHLLNGDLNRALVNFLSGVSCLVDSEQYDKALAVYDRAIPALDPKMFSATLKFIEQDRIRISRRTHG